MKKLLKLSMLSLGLIASSSTFAQGACSVNYTTTNAWGSGGQQDLVITNTSAAKTSWQLCWTFNGNEVINNLWNGSYTTNGKNVCVKNAAYNGNLPANGTVAFGFTHNNAPGAKPTSFTLNGVACGGTASSSAPSSIPTTSSSVPSSIPTTSSSRSSVATTSSSSSAPSVAARWLLNETKSVLNFVSVKNTDVAENFTFSQLKGTVAADGKATLTIPLASIATGIDIRNTRMQSILWESNYLPSLHFSTQLDLGAVDAMAPGSTGVQSVTGDLVLHGVVKPIAFDVLVIKHNDRSVSFSPRKPIVINSADYDLNAGIEALRALGGVSSIGEKVPVYFKLFLTRDNPGNLPAISLATAPATPVGLVGTVSQTGSATLNWADVSTAENGFLVRRKGIEGRWATVSNLAANTSTLVNNLGTAGSYDFKVISYKDSIPSAPTAALNLVYTTNTSSSSIRSSVPPSSSSSSIGLSGDPVRGKALWESGSVGCLFCHAVNSDGTAGSSSTKIDPKNLRFATVATLPAFIAANMPKGNVGACTGQCAADTAAYFLSLKPVIVSSSASSSSVKSSSSIMATSSSLSSSSVAVTSSSRSSSSVAVLDGAQLFSAHGCAGCHGARGENPERPIVLDRWTRSTLITKIDTSMPFGNPAACDTACATAIADYILTWKPVVSCNADEDVLPRRLRLLTNSEYANTVNDLLGVTNGTAIAASFEPDSKVKGFDNNAEAAKINNGRLDAYWTAAKDLATNASVTSLLNCQTSTPRDQCASTFVPAFGKRAFRRPLVSAEQTSYSNLFRLGASNEAGARLVIQAMLSSSNFLYRSEIGSTLSGAGSLTAYEAASLLSYTFTGSMPDATLFTEADNNRLTSAVQLRTQAERLLATAKAGTQLSHFGMQWLRADDVAALDRSSVPQFNPTVGTAMRNELDAFLKEVFLKPGYKMSHVFSPGFTFLNGTLANYYGIGGVTGDQFQKVATTAQRGGVLQMGIINTNLATATGSHPIRRGLLVRRNLLCQDFAPPPPNVGEVEPLNPNKPTRERFAAHTSNPNCQSCHQYIDNIGFGFENYDAAGRYRTIEGNNIAIDASGGISGLAVMTESDSYSFNDLRGLSDILATSGLEATSKCVTRQYQRFATGISEPSECAVASSYSRWQAKSTDLRDMMLETVTSPKFLTRK